MSACAPERLADLHRAMQLIVEAVVRLAQLLEHGQQPPMSGALSLTGFDA